MKLLSKKVAIVTGGSRGIGKAIVERLAAHGASVVFTYHSSAAKANELVANLSEQYPEQSFKAYQSDASVFEQAADLVNNVVKELSREKTSDIYCSGIQILIVPGLFLQDLII